MNCKTKKKHSGLTLLELIIAVGVLVASMGALLGLFSFGHRQSVLAHRRVQAGVEAQRQMESLMGRDWDDLRDNVFYENPNLADNHDDWPVRGRNETVEDIANAGNELYATRLSSCGTFEIKISYEFRRTNHRSFYSEPGSNTPGSIWPVPPLPVPPPNYPWNGFYPAQRIPPNTNAGGLWNNQGGMGAGHLIDFDEDESRSAAEEVPISLQVRVRVYDTGGTPGTFRLFEHSNIVIVDEDMFMQSS